MWSWFTSLGWIGWIIFAIIFVIVWILLLNTGGTTT